MKWKGLLFRQANLFDGFKDLRPKKLIALIYLAYFEKIKYD